MGVARPPGLRLSCSNRIPHARGLGSSSAAIVAGITLARELVHRRPNDAARSADAWTDAAALALAARLEGHPDNVAPCLLGGFTIAWTASDGAHAVRLTPAAALSPVVYVPAARGSDRAGARRAAGPGAAPGRRLQHGPRGAARSCAHRGTRAAAGGHRGPAAPAVPCTEHAGDRGAGRAAAGAGVPAFVSGAGPSVLALVSAAGQALPDPPSGWWSRSLSYSSTGARML